MTKAELIDVFRNAGLEADEFDDSARIPGAIIEPVGNGSWFVRRDADHWVGRLLLPMTLKTLSEAKSFAGFVAQVVALEKESNQ